MNQPIEGFRDDASIDGRTKAGRAARAAMRGDVREEVRTQEAHDSIRAAELRAEQILENLDGNPGIGGELDIPANLAPEGWSYQLKAETVAGQENRHHMLSMYHTGWTPVPADRHPWLMPENYKGPIMIKGLMLMEKPTILTDRARAQEKRDALEQVRNSESALNAAPPNTAPRDDFDRHRIFKRELMRPVGGGEPMPRGE